MTNLKPPKTLNEALATVAGIVPLDDMRRRYDEPWRAHHAWHHPMAMLDDALRAEREGVVIADPLSFVIFILWHDIVYDPQSAHGRNERLSAWLCRTQLYGRIEDDVLMRANSSILSTISHVVLDAAGPDNGLQLDVDLAILGKPPMIYDQYDDGIRVEYDHVEHAVYWTHRREILSKFLARKRLYVTDWAHAQWDGPARANLARSIARSARELGE